MYCLIDFKECEYINKKKWIFKASLKSFYDLETMIHIDCIFVKYQAVAVGDTFLKRSRDFMKTIKICKVNFHCHHTNIFSKLLGVAHCF